MVAFREEYRNLVQLRSLFTRTVPFIALTATAMPHVERTIVSNLHLRNLIRISTSPNRANISYTVVEVSDDIERHFQWLVDELQNDACCERTIVFCYKKDHAQRLVRMFYTKLPQYSGTESDVIPFEYFHAGTRDYFKDKVIDSFATDHGTVRILFATTAFGVGVDCKNTHRIIHMGPPCDIDDYVQESGRAGRDGMPSQACLLLYPCYSSGRSLSPYMRDYVKNEAKICRRELLMKPFGITKPERITPCCDICDSGCSVMNF